VHAFYIVADIEDDAGENVNDERETYGQERGVDEKQAYFVNGDVEALAEIRTYPERVAFKKCQDPLQHIRSASKFYFQYHIEDTF